MNWSLWYNRDVDDNDEENDDENLDNREVMIVVVECKKIFNKPYNHHRLAFILEKNHYQKYNDNNNKNNDDGDGDDNHEE